jgi:hypothetical protein
VAWQPGSALSARAPVGLKSRNKSLLEPTRAMPRLYFGSSMKAQTRPFVVVGIRATPTRPSAATPVIVSQYDFPAAG